MKPQASAFAVLLALIGSSAAAQDGTSIPADDTPVATEPAEVPESAQAPGPAEAEQSESVATEAEATEAEEEGDFLLGVGTEAANEGHEGSLGARARLTQEDVFHTGGTVAIIGERDLERLPLDDPNAVITRAPGVYVRTEDGFGLRPNIGMRGVNPERSSRITLMEDGVLFGPAPYAAPAAYYFPLMLRMTGVEVVKGPAAILYGPSTVGGAVNLRSRPIPTEAQGRAELLYGMFRTRRAHIYYGASARNAGFLIEAADIGTDGFKDIDFDDAQTGFTRGEYVLRGFVRNDPGAHVHHRLELRAGVSFERSFETYLGLTRSDFRADETRRYVATSRDRMQWRRYEVALTHTMEVGTEFSLETTLYRHDLHRTWRRFNGFANGPNAFEVLLAPAAPQNAHYFDVLTGTADSAVDASARTDDTLIIVSNDRTFVSQGLQSVLRFDRPVTETQRIGHHLEAGVRLHYDSIVRLHTEHGYRVEARSLVADGLPDVIDTDNHGDALAVAIHAGYVLERAGLRVSPGLRAEIIRTELFDYPTATGLVAHQAVVLPGLGVSYAVTPWLAAFVGVHKGFAPVAPGQSDDVRAESSIAYEGGLRVLNTENGLSAELAGFFNDYRNLLLSCAGAGGCPSDVLDTQFNAGSANVGGIEAAFAHEFELRGTLRMPIRASYTLTLARFRHVADTAIGTPGYEEAVDGAHLPYVPAHQAQLEVGVENDDFSATLLVAYIGRMRENASRSDDESLFTDDYVMVTLAARYALTDRVSIVARGENLLNQQPLVSRRPFGARSIRPVTAMIGFEIGI